MAKKNKKTNKTNLERRDLLKGLAGVPVAGFFLLNLWQKVKRDKIKKSNLLSNLVNEKKAPAVVKSLSNSRHLNIGVIGYGGRGGHLVRGAGFATTGWTNTAAALFSLISLRECLWYENQQNDRLRRPGAESPCGCRWGQAVNRRHCQSLVTLRTDGTQGAENSGGSGIGSGSSWRTRWLSSDSQPGADYSAQRSGGI